jgi:hypothetical protein
MKINRIKSKSLFIISLIIINTNSLKAQWSSFCHFDTFVSPNITGNFIDADFINPDTGLYSVYYFISPSLGDGFYCKQTTDATNNWVEVIGPSGHGYTVYGVYSVRKQNTFYIPFLRGGIPSLVKSQDAGSTWIDYGTIATGYISDFFANDTTRFYVLYKSFSGNNSCLTKYTNGIKDMNYYTFTNVKTVTVFFPDTAIGYISAYDSISFKKHIVLKSSNGGISWGPVFNDTTISINRMFFTSAAYGFAVCDSGKAIKTTDGGVYWQIINTGVSVNLNSLFFLNDSLGFIAGDSGIILRTIDAGVSWTRDSVSTNESFQKIFFVNDSIGFALGFAPINNSMFKINLKSTTGIWDINNYELNKLSVFPNPSQDYFTISIPFDLKNENNLQLIIVDIGGRSMIRKIFANGKSAVNINRENLSAGLYYLSLTNGKKYFISKLILE